MNEEISKKRKKKRIKWYTYVDDELHGYLEQFMESFKLKNRAKFIRNGVKYYINHLEQVMEKEIEMIDFKEKKVNDIIEKAIEKYYVNTENFSVKLKQYLSPLKTSVLMLKELIDNEERALKLFENIEKAINGLEISIESEIKKPTPKRFVKNFDLLHIEDNELDRRVIHDYFEDKGVKITSVETAEEALDILHHATPKAFLIDYALTTSRFNGDKLCKLLKSKEEYQDKAVYIISAMISEEQKRDVIAKCNADCIITKPIKSLKELDVILTNL